MAEKQALFRSAKRREWPFSAAPAGHLPARCLRSRCRTDSMVGAAVHGPKAHYGASNCTFMNSRTRTRAPSPPRVVPLLESVAIRLTGTGVGAGAGLDIGQYLVARAPIGVGQLPWR